MPIDFLADTFLNKPIWMWLAFAGVVVTLLVLDLGVFHRDNHVIGVRESLLLSSFYITIAVIFGGWVWWELGAEAGQQYLTGFVVEKTLALDNIFVISLIFTYFAIPAHLQHRVLFWGILGVIVLRGLMIAAGTVLVTQYAWILYFFALFLIATGIKMLWSDDAPPDISQNRILLVLKRFLPMTDKLHAERFFVREAHPKTGTVRRVATPLFAALVMIEIVDVVFAVDSVPAIFTITTDPYIVYTSNIFAILGLRALYFALAAILERFKYLKPALALVLVFIGSKIFVADIMGWEKFPAGWSLGITIGILATGVFYSLFKTRVANRPAERTI